MDDYEPLEDHDGVPAQSSIAAPLLRALLFAGLAFGIYGLIFGNLLGSDDPLDDVALTESPPSAQPVVVTPASPLEFMPTVEPTTAATPGVGGTEAPPTAGQIGSGVTAQVIAGANTSADQFASAVAALRTLGYTVTEAGVSGNPYPQTTVFATAGQDAQAQALVVGDERFTTVAENPGNLTAQIQIHVLVGEDWPTS